MALIYMNGFEWNSWYENIHTHYGGSISTYANPSFSDTNVYPRSGSYLASIDAWDWIRLTHPAATEFYFQAAINFNSVLSSTLGDVEIPFIRFRSGPGSTVLGTIYFNNQLQRLSAGTSAQIAQSSFTLSFYKWYVFEFYWKFSTSSGAFNSRIDGNADMSFTGSTGTNLPCSSVDFAIESVSGKYFYCQIDDIVINDVSGSENISWPNGARVLLRHPNGKGSSSEWYKEPSSTIDNYQCVDGWPSIDPTEYVYTDLNAKTDLYSFPSLPAEANSVLAVRADAWAQKNSGTTMTMNLAIKPSGGSVDISSAHLLNISYSLQQNVWEENPDTSSAWTPAEVNVIEAGFKSIV